MHVISWEKFILIIVILVIILLLRITIGIIKWVVKTIRYVFTGNRRREDPIHSRDWMTRAQARQKIRFDNATPPLRSETKPQKKTWRQKRNLNQGRSENGWTFNEETQLWEPPKNLK